MKRVVKFFLIVFFAAAGFLVRAQAPHGSYEAGNCPSVFSEGIGPQAGFSEDESDSFEGNVPHSEFSVEAADSSGAGERIVMFWNLENFFDYIDQGTSASDAEFSSRGARHWTKARFYAKCDAVAKMILWVGDRYGSLPSVVGFAEVENGWVMRQLINNTALRKFGYRLVHYESPDSRGIDVALIYREDVYDLLDSKPCHIYEGDKIMNTRDILLVTLRERESGEVTRFLVNHHPSKYGGEVVSRPKRLAAMTRLKSLCDSIFALTSPPSGEAVGPDEHIPDPVRADGTSDRASGARIIAMGDFNDTPDNPLFGIFGDTMVNKAYPLYKKGYGTIKYQGKWELIDMFIISAAMDCIGTDGPAREATTGVSEEGRREEGETVKMSDKSKNKRAEEGKYRMEIVEAPFHTQRDNSHVGEKPLRTYSGPRYLGGISDHFPIVLILSSD